MAYVDKINVSGSDYDVHDKRISNSEADVCVKPLYYHPIYIIDVNLKFQGSCVIINNSPTAFTWATFKAFIEDLDEFNLNPVNFCYLDEYQSLIISRFYWNKSAEKMYAYGVDSKNDLLVNAQDFTSVWNNILAEGHVGGITDSVNKLN